MAGPGNPHGHPAWFGSVMGTGALGLAVSSQESLLDATWPVAVGMLLVLLASLLAIVLAPRYFGRLARRETLAHEIGDPAHGPMLATVPAGLLVLSIGWSRVATQYVPEAVGMWVAGILLVLGAVIALALGLTWSAAMFQQSQGLERVNGGWLIPPVMNLLVPLALAPFIANNPGSAMGLLLLAFAFYGVGIILFLIVMTLLVARFAAHEPLPAMMAPSMWIPLAPAGVLGLSFLRLQQAATQADVPGFSGATAGVMLSAVGIGFGLWWAGFAGLELRRIRAAGGPPVHPGWWGFVFPVAAMVLSISALAAATEVAVLGWLGLLATIGLAALWAFVAWRTFPLLQRKAMTPAQAGGGHGAPGTH